jgi:CheY-like chemotaxis protein
VRRCCDGDEALDYLHRRGGFAAAGGAPRPAVVLLDLNLPGTDGREVLEHVKGDEGLRSIPVVVFTTSSNPGDVQASYRTGASGFIIKPIRFEELMRAVENLKGYWLDTVALPPE